MTSFALCAVLGTALLGQAETTSAAPAAESTTTSTTTTTTTTESAAPAPSGFDALNVARMSDYIPGFKDIRDQVADAGISFNIGMTQFVQTSGGGAISSGAFRYTGSLDLDVSLDFGKLTKLEALDGLSLYLYADVGFGQSINAKVQALWAAPNGDVFADYGMQMTEYWLQYRKTWDQLTFQGRLGKIDYTRTFDANAYSNYEWRDFLNYAFQNNPHMQVTDNAANIGLGAEILLEYQINEEFTPYFATGIYAADQLLGTIGFNEAFGSSPYAPGTSGPGSDRLGATQGPDALWLFETGLKHKFLDHGNGKMPGAIRVGGGYTGQPSLTTNFRSYGVLGPKYNSGYGFFYMNFDQMVFKEKADSDTEGLGVFGRFSVGQSNSAIPPYQIPINQFYSFGLSYTGLIPTRDKDVTAFGYALMSMYPSTDPSQTGVGQTTYSDEQVFEWYYMINVFDWLQVTPDLQYIIRPGGNSDTRDAVVAGVRFQMTF